MDGVRNKGVNLINFIPLEENIRKYLRFKEIP